MQLGAGIEEPHLYNKFIGILREYTAGKTVVTRDLYKGAALVTVYGDIYATVRNHGDFLEVTASKNYALRECIISEIDDINEKLGELLNF